MSRKAIFISVISHFAFFGIFNFSFGNKISVVRYNNISFFGQILPESDLKDPEKWGRFYFSGEGKSRKIEPSPFFTKATRSDFLFDISILEYSKKPVEGSLFSKNKISFTPELKLPEASLKRKKEQVVMFYPRLPYNYLLFFKDRQTAHIEIAFSITSLTGQNSIMVKRKISSGNLEADLLVMRYISRYLSIEQPNFVADNWQMVKIDLSAKE